MGVLLTCWSLHLHPSALHRRFYESVVWWGGARGGLPPHLTLASWELEAMMPALMSGNTVAALPMRLEASR